MNRRLLLMFSDKRVQRTVLLLLLWVPAVLVLLLVREVLLPFLLAFALAYVIAPVVRWMSSRRIGTWSPPRWVSVVTLYVTAAVIVFVTGRIFVPQLYKELSRLGGEANVAFHQLSDESIAQQADLLEAWVKRNDLPIRIVTAEDEDPLAAGTVYGPLPQPTTNTWSIDVVTVAQDLIRDVKNVAREKAGHAVAQLQTVIARAMGFVFSTFLVLMLTAFIVGDAERIIAFFFSITPVRDRDGMRELLGRIDRGLSGVVRGQLTICIINGLLTLVGLLLLKVKFAFLLASLAAVFSLVPIFGSIMSTIPIVVVGLSSGISTALLAVLWIVGIHALEANFLNPKIMGDAAKIHPVLVVLALIIGEHFYGLAGALFAVPLMSIVVTIWKAVRGKAMQLDDEIAAVEANPVVALPRMRRMRRRDGG
ncbi:MAG TPA: AI-2E family transporter [Myxococcota bacterium]